MTRRPPTTETRTVLRTILSAGVLAVLVLACAGAAAGATTWVVDDSGGADFTSIQAARLTDYHAQNDLYTIITPRAIDQW